MRTLLQLMQSIKFVDIGAFVEARNSDNTVLGMFTHPIHEGDKALDAYKQELFKLMACWTSTIVLKTRCGCTQMLEEHESNRNLRLPLHTSGSLLVSASLSDSLPLKTREFKYYNKHDPDTGCRLFEEIE